MAYYRLCPHVEVSVTRENGMISKAVIQKTTTGENREYSDKTRAGILACFEDNPEYGQTECIALKLDLQEKCVEQHINALKMEHYFSDVTKEYTLFP